MSAVDSPIVAASASVADAVITTVVDATQPDVATVFPRMDLATGIGLILAATATLALIAAVRHLDVPGVLHFVLTPVGMAASVIGSSICAASCYQFGGHLKGPVSNNPWAFGGTVISAGLGGFLLIPNAAEGVQQQEAH